MCDLSNVRQISLNLSDFHPLSMFSKPVLVLVHFLQVHFKLRK